MSEKMLFQQMNFIRKRTIAALDATPDSLARVIPEGFKNNMLWNFGHIFVAQDNMLYSFLNETHGIPSHYKELFDMGSAPINWTTEPPSLLELRTYLEKQPDRIMKTFSGRLAEEGKKPFILGPDTKFTRLDEVLLFSIWHEGLHQGAVNSMKRALGVEDLWAVVDK